MIVNNGIPDKDFKHIAASLENFVERYERGVAKPPQLELAEMIEAYARSDRRDRRLIVSQTVHTHAPYLPATQWFTFTMEGDEQTREFHIFVDGDMWPEGVLFYRRITNADDPAVKAGVPAAIGSYLDPLSPKNLDWFR